LRRSVKAGCADAESVGKDEVESWDGRKGRGQSERVGRVFSQGHWRVISEEREFGGSLGSLYESWGS
jgi:hypothetical protein